MSLSRLTRFYECIVVACTMTEDKRGLSGKKYESSTVGKIQRAISYSNSRISMYSNHMSPNDGNPTTRFPY